MDDAAPLLDRALAGDRRALARAITLVELRKPSVVAALARAHVRRRTGPGHPQVVGLTGPPGAGKSTLVDALVARARGRGQRVGVIAVDPCSPFTGGAILGDRIRMERHTGDDGVFVRSLSSRGHAGGLSASAGQVTDLLDAAGFDLVLVETVGVGQGEIGVMEVADTVAVVLTPESGDAVQAMKAGLLEVADVFAVNKADRPGADAVVRELERTVALGVSDPAAVEAGTVWAPPVHKVTAATGDGLEVLCGALDRHVAWCAGPGREAWAERRGDARLRAALDDVAERARRAARARWDADGSTERIRAGAPPEPREPEPLAARETP